MHAEEVCTSDSVTDDTARMRINVIKTALCSSPNEPNISFAASGAKIYSPAAAGRDTAKVIKSALNDCFFASGIFPLSARGEICGTPAAARP